MSTNDKNIFEKDLEKSNANYVAQSPLSWIKRSAEIFPNITAIIHGKISFTWQETFSRCRQLASALMGLAYEKETLLQSLRQTFQRSMNLLFAIPALGAVINPINIRLDFEAIRFILEHGEAKAILVDTDFADVTKAAVEGIKKKPYIIDIADINAQNHERIGEVEYEEFIKSGDKKFPLDSSL